jgi:hypothetical protein
MTKPWPTRGCCAMGGGGGRVQKCSNYNLSGTWRRVIWRVLPDVSNGRRALMWTVKVWLLDPGTVRNVWKYLRVDTTVMSLKTSIFKYCQITKLDCSMRGYCTDSKLLNARTIQSQHTPHPIFIFLRYLPPFMLHPVAKMFHINFTRLYTIWSKQISNQ